MDEGARKLRRIGSISSGENTVLINQVSITNLPGGT